jgi:hypothetical protein
MDHTATQRPSEVIGGNTAFYTIYTLVDITDANISSPKVDAKGFYQSQNLNTFMQTIGLRTQPIISSVRKLESQSTADYMFGTDFDNTQQTMWILTFVSDTDRAWFKQDDYTALLKTDFKFTPIHINLDDTATNNNEIIHTQDDAQLNTYFKFSENI